jgi:C4-type Zn-finger protein
MAKVIFQDQFKRVMCIKSCRVSLKLEMMTVFNYEDVDCPHCGHRNRIRFTVKTIPFGETTVVPEGPDDCFKCKGLFVGTVVTTYGARKLTRYEERLMEQKQKKSEGD